MKKRFIKSIIVTILVLSMTITPLALFAQAASSMSTSQTTFALGKVTSFVITCHGITGLEAAGIEVKYDPEMLEVVSVTNAGCFNGALYNARLKEPGLVTAGAAYSTSNKVDSATAVIINFRSINTGDTNISVKIVEWEGTTAPSNATFNIHIEPFHYQIINNSYVIIKSMGPNSFISEINIPSKIEGKPVTVIDDSAFSGCSSLQSITIPDSITSIGNSAFSGCSSLPSITIPDSVTSIGDYAFKDCSSLRSITIPDSVTSISSSAFYGCNALESITIPDSVTSIGGSAFSGCSSLQSVTIPASVEYIGGSAFANCSQLTDVYFENDDIFTIADSYVFPRGVTFHGYTGCTAEVFAKVFGYKFVAMDGEPTTEPTTTPDEPTTLPDEPTTLPDEPTTLPEEPTTLPEENEPTIKNSLIDMFNAIKAFFTALTNFFNRLFSFGR